MLNIFMLCEIDSDSLTEHKFTPPYPYRDHNKIPADLTVRALLFMTSLAKGIIIILIVPFNHQNSCL